MDYKYLYETQERLAAERARQLEEMKAKLKALEDKIKEVTDIF